MFIFLVCTNILLELMSDTFVQLQKSPHFMPLFETAWLILLHRLAASKPHKRKHALHYKPENAAARRKSANFGVLETRKGLGRLVLVGKSLAIHVA